MSPVPTRLACLLVTIFVGMTMLSAGSSLLAHEPDASPTEIPFAELPECPLSTPDSSVPTPIPDLSAAAPRCRAKDVIALDVRALIEQGIDLRTIGIAGDAVASEASTPSPSATPFFSGNTFVSPAATPAAANVPRQVNTLYLPMMSR